MSNRPSATILRFGIFGGILILLSLLFLFAPSMTSHYEVLQEILRLAFLAWIAVGIAVATKTLLAWAVRKGTAPGFFVSVYEDGFWWSIWSIYNRRAFHAARLPIVMTTWSFVILGIVGMIALSGRLDESEFNFTKPSDFRHSVEPGVKTKVFSLITGDNNPTQYLKDAATLVSTFQRMGARLVVIERPTILTERPDHVKLLDSIRSSGIAVFYSHWYPTGHEVYPPVENNRSLQQPDYVPPLRVVYMFPYVPKFIPRGGKIAWHPCAFGGAYLTEDVALATVARYSGLPDSARPECTARDVTIGNTTIPVRANGEAMSIATLPVDSLWLTVSAVRELDSDSLKFYSFKNSEEVPADSPELRSQVAGKIVVVQWTVESAFGSVDPPGYTLAGIIESVMRNCLITEVSWVPYVLTPLIVAFSALLFGRISIRAAIAIIFGLAATLFCGSIWMLVVHHALLHMAYPALGAILSALLLPLVRLSHER